MGEKSQTGWICRICSDGPCVSMTCACPKFCPCAGERRLAFERFYGSITDPEARPEVEKP
jgi:hypothetical protein